MVEVEIKATWDLAQRKTIVFPELYKLCDPDISTIHRQDVDWDVIDWIVYCIVPGRSWCLSRH
jgi:hypothetical protein